MVLHFTVRNQKIQWSNPTRSPVEGTVGEVHAQFSVDSEWEGRTITVVFSNEEGGAPLPELILWTGEPVKVPAVVLVDGVLRVGLVGVMDGKTLTTRYMERGVPVYRSGGKGGDVVDPDPTLLEQILSAAGGYYTPHVAEDGTLSWSGNRDGMPEIPEVNIIGPKGSTGNGILRTELNDDYTLTIFYTDGSSFTTPVIRGEKGDIGAGIQNIVMNDDYTLTIYYGDGSSLTTPPIRGEKGDTGNGIKEIALQDDYGLKITYTDGTDFTTPSIRGEKGETGNGIKEISLQNDYALKIIYTDGSSFATPSIRGAKGETGNGIQEIVANEDYTLTVKYSDGTDFTTPSIRGEPGQDGSDGITPHIGSNGNWFVGETDTGTPATGEPGPQGLPGENGRGIVSNERTGGDGSPGSKDIYTMTYTDGSTTEWSVYNGADKEQTVITVGFSDAYDYVCDGEADEVEINAALAALPKSGGVLQFATGTYNLAGRIYGTGFLDLVIAGEYSRTTKFVRQFKGTSMGMSMITLGTVENNLTVRNIQLESDPAVWGQEEASGFEVTVGYGLVTVENCKFTGHSTGIQAESFNSGRMEVRNCTFENCAIGAYVLAGDLYQCKFVGCGEGVQMRGKDQIVRDSLFFDNDTGVHVWSSADNAQILDNVIVRGTGEESDYTADQHTILLGVIFEDYAMYAANTMIAGNILKGKDVSFQPVEPGEDYVEAFNSVRIINAGTGNGDAAQADWNAAEGEPGHVLNRTHYDARSYHEIDIQWNGDIVGKETIITDTENESVKYVYCKVSDEKLSVNTLNGATVVMVDSDSLQMELIVGQMAQIIELDAANGLWEVNVNGSHIVYLSHGDIEYNGMNFTQGVYFWSIQNYDEITQWISQLKNTVVEGELKQLPDKFIPDVIQRTINGTKGQVVGFDENGAAVPQSATGGDWLTKEGEPGHILNRTHFSETSKSWKLGPEELAFQGGMYEYAYPMLAYLFDENADATYTVTLDGVEYGSSIKSLDLGGGMTFLYLGNIALAGVGENTGEPFAIVTIPAQSKTMVVVSEGTDETHELGIFLWEEVVVKRLDENYLPESVDGVVIRSSTEGSTKKFCMAVDDAGTPSMTDTTDGSVVWSGSGSIPYFDLVEMGLPASDLSGDEVSAEVDTTELIAAIRNGPVKLCVGVDVGMVINAYPVVCFTEVPDMDYFQTSFILQAMGPQLLTITIENNRVLGFVLTLATS